MRARFRFAVLLAALFTSVSLLAQPPAPLGLGQILARMDAARNRTQVAEPILVTREYRMFHGDDTKPSSEVTAEISVVPPDEHDYRIVDSKGSGRGEKVVRKILDHEAKAEKSHPSPTAIIRENYDFSFEGEQSFQGKRCYVLLLHPKRDDLSLVKGRAWVDANTFLVRKVEGEMAKSPSWWVKEVKLSVQFGEIGGVWTQTATDAVAEVRWFGKYTVNGRATSLQAGEPLAAAKPGKPLNRRVPAGVLAPGVLVPH